MAKRWKNRYLHLIDGRPALYIQGMQICFMRNGESMKFCRSLRQVYREQQASTRWRLEHRYPSHQQSYGYLRIKNR